MQSAVPKRAYLLPPVSAIALKDASASKGTSQVMHGVQKSPEQTAIIAAVGRAPDAPTDII